MSFSRVIWLLIQLGLCVGLTLCAFAQPASAQSETIRPSAEVLLPYLKNYSPEDYGSKKGQNWSVTQDKRGVVYVANNDGVLEYDGIEWRDIKVGDEVGIKVGDERNAFSLARDDVGRVFVGSVEQIGMLKPNDRGQMRYLSLNSYLDTADLDFGEVRSISVIGNEIFFQADEHIFRWNPDTRKMKVFHGEEFHTSFVYQNTFYVRRRQVGLLRLEKEQLVPAPGGELFADNPVYFILPMDEKRGLVGTLRSGLFVYDGVKFERFRTQSDAYILDHNLYCGAYSRLSGVMALGTFTGGVIILNNKGELLQVVNEQIGLQNNEVNFAYFDNQNGLWLALGNGITRLETPAPLSNQARFGGKKASVVEVKRVGQTLYLITSIGVFRGEIVKDEYGLSHQEFKLVPGTVKQCWSGFVWGNNLLVGAGEEIISISDFGVTPLFEYSTSCFHRSEKNPNRVYVGTIDGLASIRYENGVWIDEGRVAPDEIENEVQSIQEDEYGNLWASIVLQGVIYVDFRKGGRAKPTVTKLGKKNGFLTTNEIYVKRVQKKIYFTTKDGLYTFDAPSKTFKFCSDFGKEFTDGRHGLKKLYESPNGDIYFVTQFKGLSYDTVKVRRRHANGSYSLNAAEFTRMTKAEVHDLYIEPNGVVWLAHENGLDRYDPRIHKNYKIHCPTIIRNVSSVGDTVLFGGAFYDDAHVPQLAQNDVLKPRLSYKFNTLRFDCASLSFDKATANEYQYFLEGQDDDWSNWSRVAYKEYTNLRERDYKFRVRSRNIYMNTSEQAVFEFSIAPPWYRTPWAYILYAISFAGGVYGFIRWRLAKLQQEKVVLEQKVEERTAEVRRQAKELEHKNEEIMQRSEEIMQQRDEILAINESLQGANDEITKQKEEIEHQNTEIHDSIVYASRIQFAILPAVDSIKQSLNDSFVLYKPKDIVSGDFFWFSNKYEEEQDFIHVSAVDCTGHGVPGAFMSVLGSSLLNQIVNEREVFDPGEILNMLNTLVQVNLHQIEPGSDSKDGMDMCLVQYNKKTMELKFAGANNPMYYIRNGELQEFKVDKYPIGGGQYENRSFVTQSLQLEPGDRFYLFSDGYADQFGGPMKRKFMYGKFKKMLVAISEKPEDEQHKILNDTIESWRTEAGIEQIDDILVIGVRV